MAEQQLNRAQVRSGLQQMGGEGVSQDMRCDGLCQPGTLAGLLADQVYRAAVQWLVRLHSREEPMRRAVCLPVLAQQYEQIGGKHDHPIFSPFALPDANEI